MNNQIRQFRDSIIAMVNASPLPIEIKRLIFSEIQLQISTESNRVIALEKEEEIKNVKEKNTND